MATGLWLFVAGLFFDETNIWYVVGGGGLPDPIPGPAAQGDIDQRGP